MSTSSCRVPETSRATNLAVTRGACQPVSRAVAPDINRGLLATDLSAKEVYAYLHTQAAQMQTQDVEHSKGMLLHPKCGQAFDAYVDMQGYRMWFKTINLMGSAEEFEMHILSIGNRIMGFATA